MSEKYCRRTTLVRVAQQQEFDSLFPTRSDRATDHGDPPRTALRHRSVHAQVANDPPAGFGFTVPDNNPDKMWR